MTERYVYFFVHGKNSQRDAKVTRKLHTFFYASHPVVLYYLMVNFITVYNTTIHKWSKNFFIDYGDMFRLLCNHHQAVLRHIEGTKVHTVWDPISFITHVKILF
jgi:hypothetical protein